MNNQVFRFLDVTESVSAMADAPPVNFGVHVAVFERLLAWRLIPDCDSSPRSGAFLSQPDLI